jgi:murein L,D-transpeptidase YafK
MKYLVLAVAALFFSACTTVKHVGKKAEVILVKKAERKLYLFRKNQVIGSYDISLGTNPIGHKTRQGDGRTPEGWYTIDFKNENSKYRKSLNISYPNELDKRRARSMRVRPGDDIVIHAVANHLNTKDQIMSMRGWDWTNGCIAVDNKAIEDIWNKVDEGTPILIQP